MTVDPRPPRKVRGIENRLRKNRDGSTYWQFRVRWTDPVSGRRLVEIFDAQQDAVDFQAALRLARRRGALEEFDRGRDTLVEFVELEWWPNHAAKNLAPSTLNSYANIWNNHVLGRVGGLQLRHLTPPVMQQLREDLEAADCQGCKGTGELPAKEKDGAPRRCHFCTGRGTLGPDTVRRALSMLQGICRYAIARGEMTSNPVREIDKPDVTRQRTVVAVSPRQVERLLEALDPRSRILCALMSYEGLRPEEALAVEDKHFGRSSILLEQKNVDGTLVPGLKQRRRGQARDSRSPELFGPVRADVAAYRLVTERARARDGRQLLIPRADGEPWRETDYRNWRRRVFMPAVRKAGLPITRPYDLRHACASLLIHAGWPLTEIAEHMGHSVGTLSRVYAHAIKDMKGQKPIPPAAQITRARAARERRRSADA